MRRIRERSWRARPILWCCCLVVSFLDLNGFTWFREGTEPVRKPASPNGSSNGQPKLRDRLCVLIRQYNLDPVLHTGQSVRCGLQRHTLPYRRERPRKVNQKWVDTSYRSSQ
jgi:hypothetical protein